MKRFYVGIMMIIILIGLSGCNDSKDEILNEDENKTVQCNEKTTLNYDTNKISEEVIQSNTQFAFNIFKQLNQEDRGKNIFISPLSISTALTMTYEGAGGTTKEEMEKALAYVGVDRSELNDSYQNLLPYLKDLDENVELDINNSIWFKKGEKINQSFLDINSQVFDAYITDLDFSKKDSADKINEWIKDATNGKISKMIDAPIPSDIFMYLINAIYFKGEWAEPFEEKNTYATTFLSEQGQKQEVELMVRKDKIAYTSDTNYKAIRLPYGNEALSMYCILPNEGIDINDLIEWIDVEKWQRIENSLLKDTVTVKIPKFRLEYGIRDLNESLANLGMGKAFTDSADFSGIRDQLKISRVLHKAVIEVNEEGSEAAAVTVVEIKATAAKIEEPLTFIADRPFIFIIADDELENILFIGKMSDITN